MSKTRDLHQLLLPSGRGVRMLELTPSERDSITKKTANLVDKNATIADFQITALREGISTCIKQVTVAKYKSVEDLVGLEQKCWKDVSRLDLEDNYDDYFTTKDDHVLTVVYRRMHEVSMDDVEKIVGKVQMVSAD